MKETPAGGCSNRIGGYNVALECANDSNSMGNRLVTYKNIIIPEIDLLNRVQLVPELEHFVGRPPPNPAQAGMPSQVGTGGGRVHPRENFMENILTI